MNKKLTPNIIEVMLHCYVSPEPHPRREAEAVHDAINALLKADLIQSVPPASYRATAKGEAFVQMLCSTPFPIEGYIDPRTNTIIER